MGDKPKIEVRKKGEQNPAPPDEEYLLFTNIKGATIRAARLIYKKRGKDAPADVQKFVEQFG